METEEQNHETNSPKRRRHTEPEVIDLTMSSPIASIPAEQCAFMINLTIWSQFQKGLRALDLIMAVPVRMNTR